MSHHKVIIVGTGPAGYTAALYTSRANLAPLVFEGAQPGGQLTITTEVENFPGFRHGVMGPQLMEEMREQVLRFGTTIKSETVLKANLQVRPFQITTDKGEYTADAVIIATGASAKWMGIQKDEQLSRTGGGVSACATCDGFFFRGKEVVVVGGGNTAVEEALYLTHHASKVTLIHRRDSFRAEKILQERLFKNPKVTVLWDHTVEEIVGEASPAPLVKGVRVRNVKTGAEQEIATDGVFIAIGHSPNTELFKGKLAMDSEGYLITKPDSTATDVAGVYAAGDVQDKIFRQAVTAAGTGCMAALEAEKWLATQEARLAQAAE